MQDTNVYCALKILLNLLLFEKNTTTHKPQNKSFMWDINTGNVRPKESYEQMINGTET